MQRYLDGRVLVDWADVAVAEPLLRDLVARITDVDPGPLFHRCPFCGSVEHGQPYVDAPVHVSVAHAPGLTVVAVSALGPIGVDVEADASQDWVVREAIGKAVGVGITTDDLPEPTWHSAVEIPGHAAAVAVFSDAEAPEAAPGTTSSRTAD